MDTKEKLYIVRRRIGTLNERTKYEQHGGPLPRDVASCITRRLNRACKHTYGAALWSFVPAEGEVAAA